MTDNDWLHECRRLCRQVKSLAEPFEWAERPNHAGTLSASGGLLDSRETAIPGLRVKFEWQLRDYGEYASYALMYRRAGTVFRAFMLEVMPGHHLSHRDHECAIHGSHIQLSDARQGAGQSVVRQVVTELKLSDHVRWMRRFQRHAHTFSSGQYTLGTVSGPLFDGVR